jgi:predicted cupin superfamily sugar epimerase
VRKSHGRRDAWLAHVIAICHSYQRGTSSNYLAIAGFQHWLMEGRARDPVDCTFAEGFDFVDPDLLRRRKMRVSAESD